MNPAVGDLEGNVEKIRSTTLEAKRKGVQILAFPELMLCGYPPEDLLLKPRFLQDCEAALEKAARDRAVSVKSAVRVALKALDAASDERLHLANLPDDEITDLVEDPLDLDLKVDRIADDRKEGSS